MRRSLLTVMALAATLASCQTTTTPGPDGGGEVREVWPERPDRPLDAGRVTLKRLTNMEYDNTVAELLFTDKRPSADFPPDELAHGWDHMADAQTVSPLHIDMYLQAALDLVETELASPVVPGQTWTFEGEDDLVATTGGDSGEFWNLWSNGSAEATVNAPYAGRYRLEAYLGATQGGPDLARAALLVDGASASEVEVTGSREFNIYSVEVELTAGVHSIGVAFLNDYYEAGVADRNLLVDYVELVGPLDVSGEPTKARSTYYTCEPTSEDDEACAFEILEGFAQRAWRRPLSMEGKTFVRAVYTRAKAADASWEEAVHTGAVGVLLSPRFLFRLELDPDPTSKVSRPLDDYELASRLSYFLWRTMPDDRLLELASKGQLQDDAVLKAEVQRMLADERAHTIVTEYAGQWLHIRAIDSVTPDYADFPEFDDDLRAGMKTEMEAFAASILLEDRSMLDLLTAEETFVTPRLAEHYGVPYPDGAGDVAEVVIDDYPRAGLFGKAGLLTSLALPKRTSPVKRGQWVMANLLCEAPPPAPANVEGLKEDTEGMSLRERMQKHREDPACATCHRVMDPIGFSMENYDAIGAWRTTDADGYDIDASGTWPGGPSFDDSVDLAWALSEDPRVPDCMAQVTFAYAMGRPAGIEDLPYLDGIRADFGAGEHRFAALVESIVLSAPFRTRRGEPEEGR